jgi:hypothetical protein
MPSGSGPSAALRAPLLTVQMASGGVLAFKYFRRTWIGALGRCLTALMFLGSSVLLASAVEAIDAPQRARPIKIGALTDSWGPTPCMAGLRDGLVERGYREGEQFEIGVRFTQGDIAALPAAARDLVQYKWTSSS